MRIYNNSCCALPVTAANKMQREMHYAAQIHVYMRTDNRRRIGLRLRRVLDRRLFERARF